MVWVWGRRSGENRSPLRRVDSGLRRNDEKIGMTGKIGMTEKLRGKDDAGKGGVSIPVVWMWGRRSGENWSPS